MRSEPPSLAEVVVAGVVVPRFSVFGIVNFGCWKEALPAGVLARAAQPRRKGCNCALGFVAELGDINTLSGKLQRRVWRCCGWRRRRRWSWGRRRCCGGRRRSRRGLRRCRRCDRRRHRCRGPGRRRRHLCRGQTNRHRGVFTLDIAPARRGQHSCGDRKTKDRPSRRTHFQPPYPPHLALS